MNREVHVRFSESARVKFPRATRLYPLYFQLVFGYIDETKRVLLLDMIETVMKRGRCTFFLFMAFLFAFTCAYSLFDEIREADFFSARKYEATDIDDVYAEKQSSPDAALLSPALFSPLPGILFEFLPNSVSSPNTLLRPFFSVLRC